jgi:hypothetical protein
MTNLGGVSDRQIWFIISVSSTCELWQVTTTHFFKITGSSMIEISSISVSCFCHCNLFRQITLRWRETSKIKLHSCTLAHQPEHHPLLTGDRLEQWMNRGIQISRRPRDGKNSALSKKIRERTLFFFRFHPNSNMIDPRQEETRKLPFQHLTRCTEVHKFCYR